MQFSFSGQDKLVQQAAQIKAQYETLSKILPEDQIPPQLKKIKQLVERAETKLR